MNIFFLHGDQRVCARMHVNRHVVKMILEYCQMMDTAWHVQDPHQERFRPHCKKAYINHPCTRWVRESRDNYRWLACLALELCREYTFRYGKIHKLHPHICALVSNVPDLPDNGLTVFPQAMDDQYKRPQPIDAYRNYYANGKTHLHTWTTKLGGRCEPTFIKEWQNKHCHGANGIQDACPVALASTASPRTES